MSDRQASVSVPVLGKTNKWWFQDAGLRRLYFLLLVAIMSSATNGYDGSLMNGLQSLTYWQEYFKYPRGSQQGILNAIQSIGAIASLLFGPVLSDTIGRKFTIFIGCIVICIGAAIQTASTTVAIFTAARFFIGLGSGICAIASPLLITELCHPRQRGKVTAVYNTMYYFGATLGGWITYATLRIPSDWSWRLPSLLQAAPSIFQLCLVLLLPESPRWLVAHNKPERALTILAKYHSNGNENDEGVQFEFAEIQAAIEFEKHNSKDKWLELFRGKPNRMRIFICLCCGIFSQFSGTSLTAYYLAKILDGIGITDPWYQTRLNGFITLVNLAEAWFWCLFVDKIGRRPLFQMASIGMIFTFGIWIALTAKQTASGEVSYGKGIIAMIFFHNFFVQYVLLMQTLLANTLITFHRTSLNVAYPIEILPYNIRANGLMLQSFATNLALFFAQYVNPLGIEAGSWKFYFFYEGWIIIQAVVVYFFFIETKGKTLEEISRLFDGEDAVEALKGEAIGMEFQGEQKSSGAAYNEDIKHGGVETIHDYPKDSTGGAYQRRASVTAEKELRALDWTRWRKPDSVSAVGRRVQCA